jgi:hypothetical protein
VKISLDCENKKKIAFTVEKTKTHAHDKGNDRSACNLGGVVCKIGFTKLKRNDYEYTKMNENDYIQWKHHVLEIRKKMCQESEQVCATPGQILNGNKYVRAGY